MSTEEARIWQAWCEATGASVTPGAGWVARFLEGSTGVLAWPVRLHPSMNWLEPRLYDRSSPPETFEDLAVILSEAPVPAGRSVGDLLDPVHRIRAHQGSPLRSAFGPILPVGTSIWFDGFVPDGCDGFDRLEATALGTPTGDLRVDLPVGRAGAAYLLARLAVVDGSDPLASDHASAEALHQRLIALLDSREDDAPIAGGTAVATLPRTSPTARLARLARAVFVRS